MAKGRPQLKSGKRTKKIDVRFTDDEYNLIITLEQTLGISKTELLRKRVLNNAPTVIINAKELIMSLDDIFSELGRIGNNINQLAKHANTLKLQGALSPLVAEQFNVHFHKYLQIQLQLEISLRKVIRLVGRS
ncbi:mobilisation protein (MobC) [Mucilaginibacter gossypiicola]|uniref:Mobilisation protein (MobC) n=1 Tax=Mucilaginibacter gossypiicola TaxID=551995 RepID=A0A1H8D2N3_9SPHI|nr:plasmid mobilization relaxosome protein MobC [Mucilaginibacter gossypiicola]SEN01691.1 mobilisation protein (MobC) [Mucilaginibacter gossypiicola]